MYSGVLNGQNDLKWVFLCVRKFSKSAIVAILAVSDGPVSGLGFSALIGVNEPQTMANYWFFSLLFYLLYFFLPTSNNPPPPPHVKGQ